MKKCPYCKEEIQDSAIKCRYCRERIKKAKFWLSYLISFCIFAISIGGLIFIGQQVKLAGNQLKQSQLDSAIVNRPYVEIRPIKFKRSGIRDAKDIGSEFCALALEVKNSSNTIPATNVVLEDFRIGFKGVRYLTPENYPVSFKDISIFPNSAFILTLSFVMNANNMDKCDEGKKDYDIYLKITYRGIKDSKAELPHWYSCNWKYREKSLLVLDSNTDLVK